MLETRQVLFTNILLVEIYNDGNPRSELLVKEGKSSPAILGTVRGDEITPQIYMLQPLSIIQNYQNQI